MLITDKEIKKALENGGFIRRSSWREKQAAYHLTKYGVLEFVYHESGIDYTPLEDDLEAVAIEYDELLSDDWVVKDNG